MGTSLKQRAGPIRALVVEDSLTARDLLVALLNQSGDIQVVGTALDGEEAIRQAARLRPDVITMDILMPRMDGLEATRRIMKTTPTPIVIVTASLNSRDMNLTFQALRMGALTVVQKPNLSDEAICLQLVQTVRLMADVQVVRRVGRTRGLQPLRNFVQSIARQEHTSSAGSPWSATPNRSSASPSPATGDLQRNRVIIGIASSTGGPSALVTALKPLPVDFPLPILIVQHITRGFTASLCEWLGKEIKLQVRLAQQDETPQPGHVLLAPDDVHMQLSDRGAILLHSSPPFKGLRPSANYLFYSLASVYGRQAVGVILTGMGDDGVDGLAELHHRGGLTIAQDEDSSVVFGMPREAILRQAIDQSLPVDRIGYALKELPFLPIRTRQLNS